MSSFVKNFETVSFTGESSTVGVWYRVLETALYPARIWTQILVLCSPLDTITDGCNYGFGAPVTSSMIPSFFNRLSSSFTLLPCELQVLRADLYEVLRYSFPSSQCYFEK